MNCDDCQGQVILVIWHKEKNAYGCQDYRSHSACQDCSSFGASDQTHRRLGVHCCLDEALRCLNFAIVLANHMLLFEHYNGA